MARTRKRPGLKTVAKRTKRVREIEKKAAQPREEILFRVEGKMSSGRHDFGMAADEDLALSLRGGISKTRSMHICFCRLRHLVRAELGAGLTPTNIISRAAGIMPTRQRSF
jgi:hypothetical protein